MEVPNFWVSCEQEFVNEKTFNNSQSRYNTEEENVFFKSFNPNIFKSKKLCEGFCTDLAVKIKNKL